MRAPLPDAIAPDAIEAARRRIYDAAIRTPLIRFPLADSPAGHPAIAREIWLKLEILQPVGSFKIRGARNAIAALDPAGLAEGVYTASAGNMALGVAWCSRQLGVGCSVVVPDSAPRAKLDKLELLGARIIPVPYPRWWQVIEEHRFDGLPGHFIHPVSDPAVIAGNGTIGSEILEDLPGVDTVLVPFGGGGLSTGIASGLRAGKSPARVFGCEVETATPLTAAIAAGRPTRVERIPSFVDGIGGSGILPEMWPLIRRLLSGSRIVSLEETRQAIRAMAERVHVIAEGAGAVPLAAAMSGRVEGRVLCCVVSGGNIDARVVADILGGEAG